MYNFSSFALHVLLTNGMLRVYDVDNSHQEKILINFNQMRQYDDY